MTLPWFLNPWREVRRLRATIRMCDFNYKGLSAAWYEERRENYRRIREARALKEDNALLKAKIEEMQASAQSAPLCSCQRCTDARPELPGPSKPGWRYACEKCGNKRCPHHDWHGFKCTGSNEPGQVGEEG